MFLSKEQLRERRLHKLFTFLGMVATALMFGVFMMLMFALA